MESLNREIAKTKSAFTGTESIIDVIKEDHKPLKDLIEIMKDSEKPFEERKQAFTEFAPLLLTHAKAEEKALYEHMKTVSELKESAFEGDTEHSMADQLCEEIKRSLIEDEISAKIKVLAEAVEHHIQEEEKDILPEVEEKVGQDVLVQLTAKYITVQSEIIAEGQDDSQPERELNS